MGVTTAKEILDEARGTFLNDPNANEATDAIMLSHLRSAYSYLQCELTKNGLQVVNEEVVKTIPANTNEYFPLPQDLVIPRSMWERENGSTDEYREMSYVNNIPQVTAGPYLEYWTYRIDRIYFLPATTDREVKLYYLKAYPDPETSDAVLIHRCGDYLSSKTAALYLMFIRQNPTLAQTANEIAEQQLADIVNLQVKLMQSRPVRRKGYMPHRSR